MKATILFLSLFLCSTICIAQNLTGMKLLEKSISYHDPNHRWETFKDSLFITMKTPNAVDRNSRIYIDLANQSFYVKATKDTISTTYTLHKSACSILLNGNKDLSEKEKKEHQLSCERAHMYKNYYTYLYGLPMKLKDPGTIIDPKVQRKKFNQKEYLVLRVTYEKLVGKDTWYFYFDPENYAMEVYQFFHDETKNDGEYILLTEEEIKLKKILSKIVVWRYRHIPERQFIYILSVLVGFLAGLGTVLLKNFTHVIQLLLDIKFFKDYQASMYFIFPIVGLLLVFLIKKIWLKKPIGHGISTTLHSISKQSGIIERYKLFASLITAPITAGFGGSVGLQGPAVSTGAAIGSNVAQIFRMNTKTRMLLIGCATAGAMASMFKAPIAAIVFALEIFSLDIAFASLIPLLLASVAAVVTSYFFTGTDVLFRFELVDKFEIKDILFYVILGFGTGIASVYFSYWSNVVLYSSTFWRRIWFN